MQTGERIDRFEINETVTSKWQSENRQDYERQTVINYFLTEGKKPL